MSSPATLEEIAELRSLIEYNRFATSRGQATELKEEV